ncbi:OB-fold domain-containing protein [Mycobacterium sp. CVI_P3]|uniref:OB-fold domain-containing protein n=1 Tax=Mycobacterium pinniadriaticum TaxID=2994102 RepID=A0ABT3SFM6_9MYCO|nr:OB-fold domain-containing protein [Mycobacterium pinniadriaticum]MCX2931738.1 OB-fold domain-containing protein [Mycobacterium pinniadriaticum]MCX2938187.1 OB-fold domain-containing protein [Mycobacterium pinniadriaticum]
MTDIPQHPTTAHLLSYGAYVPYHRLARADIGAALGDPGGRGQRTVASYDEDTTSMGVESARIALRDAARGLAGPVKPQRVYFATAAPPYRDKTNADVIHAALGLDVSALAVDMAGSVRSGVGAVVAALDSAQPTLVVLSDIRTGLPGSSDETEGGDGSAALLFGGPDDGPALADVLAVASSTAEFLDRWRGADEQSSHVWEERFSEHAYGPHAQAAFADALKKAGLTAEGIDRLVVAGLSGRATRQFAARSGAKADAVVDNLSATVGNTGTAQPGILLADTLDRATPGTTIALVTLADGATAMILRTTEALRDHRPSLSVSDQIALGSGALPYTTFLTWRDMLRREPPRRPDPAPPAAPPSHRRADYKFGFVGSRCIECDTLHLPPSRACANCHAIDRMIPAPMSEADGRVRTLTVDHLVFTPQPPAVLAVIDFDGGGRFRCQLTDVDPSTVAVGDRVEMTFRKVLTADGIHNYFWKARPVRRGDDQDQGKPRKARGD